MLVDYWLKMIHIQIECSLEVSSTAVYSILQDHLKSRKFCARWVPHQLTHDQKQMPILFCQKLQKDLRKNNLGALYSWWIMVLSRRSRNKNNNRECQRLNTIFVQRNFRKDKSSCQQIATIFFMKSEVNSLKSRASIIVHWYVNNCLSQVLDVISQRQDSRGWFCAMTIHDLIGLLERRNFCSKLGLNPTQMHHIHLLWVPVTSFSSWNRKISWKRFILATIMRC